MGISQSLPMTGYIKMIDIWMIFTMSYPFVVITLHCLEKLTEDRGTRRINVDTAGMQGSVLNVDVDGKSDFAFLGGIKLPMEVSAVSKRWNFRCTWSY